MQFYRTILALPSVVTIALGLLPTVAQAQIVPDTSLPVNSIVAPNGNIFTIDGGTQAGGNLFHSFQDFSLPTGTEAFFNNSLDVQNIFSRVTGGNISNIDGLIRANGGASLFLLNPNGIVFGPNARLDIGGSFLGSTADSVVFQDGSVFSATEANAPPLLTINVPVGLQMGPNAGSITVQGAPANDFTLRTPTLSTAPNQTLALIGGQVEIDSANIFAPDSHVEIWAMQNGTVSIPPSGNWQLASLSSSPTWGNITLQQSSYINTSGATGGAINIRGRGLTLQDGSNIESSTGANGRGQGIHVQTTEFVDLLGISHPDHVTFPGLTTSVKGSGATAGNTTVETQRLRLANGGWINSFNLGIDFLTSSPIDNAKTGDITVHATDVEIIGYAPFRSPTTGNSFPISAIGTLILGGQQNESGAITVEAERVQLIDGGRISTDLFGAFSALTGKAGDISVTATQSLEIRGTHPDNGTSGIFSSMIGAVGQGGNVTIDTGKLALTNGGTISSQIASSPIAVLAGGGTAGNITIQATDVQVSDPLFDPLGNTLSGITVAVGENSTGQGGSINLTADSLHVFDGGQITSSTEGNGAAGNVNLQVREVEVQGISPTLVNGQFLPSAITASSSTSSAAGSVNITGETVRVGDGAEMTVSNLGTGDAGNLNLNARNIVLDNGASLRAEVNGGSQGNINLQAGELLVLRHGSQIVTNASGASAGGNIAIDAESIVAVPNENSDISANAVQGNGGKIQINTQGIFGLENRPQLTDESDITASSQFGIDGAVTITNPEVDPSSGIVNFSQEVVDPAEQVVAGCQWTADSEFIATGRSGVPTNPNRPLTSHRSWSDVRDLSAFRGETVSTVPEVSEPSRPLVEANTWVRHEDGTIELVAASTAPGSSWGSPTDCNPVENR